MMTDKQLDRFIKEAEIQKYQATSTGGNDPNQHLLRSIASSNLAIVELLQRQVELKVQKRAAIKGDEP